MNLIFFSYLYYLRYHNLEFFEIQDYSKSFYFIPENKGGQNIPNQNKKGLHLSFNDKDSIDIVKVDKLKYSIQIYSDNKYDLINNMRIELINKKNSIFSSENLFIAIFESSIGREYFLLFKNFETRVDVVNYCQKYVYFLNNCLIVNAQNLD